MNPLAIIGIITGILSLFALAVMIVAHGDPKKPGEGGEDEEVKEIFA